jgi:hypothetical protein
VPLRTDIKDALHNCALATPGITLKSKGDVAQDILGGRFEHALSQWDKGPAAIVTWDRSAEHLALKRRGAIDEFAAYVVGILAEGRGGKIKHGSWPLLLAYQVLALLAPAFLCDGIEPTPANLRSALPPDLRHALPFPSFELCIVAFRFTPKSSSLQTR